MSILFNMSSVALCASYLVALYQLLELPLIHIGFIAFLMSLVLHKINFRTEHAGRRLIAITLGLILLSALLMMSPILLRLINNHYDIILTIFIVMATAYSLSKPIAKLLSLDLPSRKPLSDNDKKRIAIHECGHLLMHAPSIDQVSLPLSATLRGDGHQEASITTHTSSDQYPSSDHVKFHLMILLSGKAAEDVVLGGASRGAEDDLERWMSVAFTHAQSCLGIALYKPVSSELESLANLKALQEYQSIQYVNAWKFMEINQAILIEMSNLLLKQQHLKHEDIIPFLKRATITNGCAALPTN